MAQKLLKKFKLNESVISMILGILVILVIGALIINYFRQVRKIPSSVSQQEELSTEEKIKIEELPTVYTVKKGDNLWKIAEVIYGSGYNWIDIARENKLNNPNILLINQQLKIPKAEVIKPNLKISSFGEPITSDTYTIVKGDHLWGIAVRAYQDGYQWVKIARENNLTNPNLIHPGNILKIPR